MWTTSTHDAATTWVTVIRNDNHVAYARVSDDGTAGLVSVRCLPDDDGTRVHVTYDLTATSDAGLGWLQHFAGRYDEMLQNWHDLTVRLLS